MFFLCKQKKITVFLGQIIYIFHEDFNYKPLRASGIILVPKFSFCLPKIHAYGSSPIEP